MPAMGNLKKGMALRIRFQAALSNDSDVAITLHWTGSDEAGSSTALTFVKAGATEPIYDAKIPTNVRALSVDVNVPEPKGRGDLEVTYNSKPPVIGHIEADQTWVFSVD